MAQKIVLKQIGYCFDFIRGFATDRHPARVISQINCDRGDRLIRSVVTVGEPENFLRERNAARKGEVGYLDLFAANAMCHARSNRILLVWRTVRCGNK